MKAEEAIKKLEYIRYVGNGEQKYQGCSEEIAINLAIEALEKQIPKKPVKWSNGTLHCPNCEKDNSCLCFKVCVECGQALDWSEEE